MKGIIVTLLLAVLECKFLSIKLLSEPSFIPIHQYDLVSFLLKGSLAEIVIKEEVEIMIASYKQVKLGKLIAKVDRDYPQWRLIDMIYRDTFDGVHLSKEDDFMRIYSLVFDAENPISFKENEETPWTGQVSYASGVLESNIVSFPGTSPFRLYKIITTLFSEHVKIRMFRNSCLFLQDNKYYSMKGPFRGELDTDDEKSETIYFLEIDRKRNRIMRFFISIPKFRRAPLVLRENKKSCFIGFKEVSTKEQALDTVRSSLSSKPSRGIRIVNVPLSRSLEGMDFNFSVISGKLSSERFMEMLHDGLDKVLFSLSVNVKVLIYYMPNESVFIEYENGALSFALKSYLIDLLKRYKVSILEYGRCLEFSVLMKAVRVEEHDGSIFSYGFNELKIIESLPLSSEFHKVFLYAMNFSFNEKVEKISIRNQDIGQVDLLGLALVVHAFDARYNVGVANSMLAIKADSENLYSIQGFIVKEAPVTQAISPISFGQLSYCKWVLLLFNSSSPIKPGYDPEPVGGRFIHSHEIVLYFWKHITKNLSILLRRTDIPINSGFPSRFERKTIIIKKMRINEKQRKKLLKLLLSHEPIFEILRIRLKFGYSIEIDLLNPNKANKFLQFINKELNMNEGIVYKLKKSLPSIHWEVGWKERRNFIPEPSRRKFNVMGGLSWENAMELLLKKPSKGHPVQVIQRNGNYAFAGHLKVIYYTEEFNLKEFIQNLKDKNQIVRMGKAENYKNDFSFFFVQLAINMNEGIFLEGETNKSLDHNTFSFNLNKMYRMDELIDFIVNIRRFSGLRTFIFHEESLGVAIEKL